jgi:hypothetical protein
MSCQFGSDGIILEECFGSGPDLYRDSNNHFLLDLNYFFIQGWFSISWGWFIIENWFVQNLVCTWFTCHEFFHDFSKVLFVNSNIFWLELLIKWCFILFFLFIIIINVNLNDSKFGNSSSSISCCWVLPLLKFSTCFPHQQILVGRVLVSLGSCLMVPACKCASWRLLMIFPIMFKKKKSERN